LVLLLLPPCGMNQNELRGEKAHTKYSERNVRKNGGRAS
jgi:hypothetical protein